MARTEDHKRVQEPKGEPVAQPSKPSFLRRANSHAFPLACGVVGTLAVLMLCDADVGEIVARWMRSGESAMPAATAPQTARWAQFSSMTAEQLDSADIAAMNLACAAGLAGTSDLDVQECLAKLDEWTNQVRAETKRQLSRFLASPATYDSSEGRFRMIVLVETLKVKCGVRLDPKRPRRIDYRDPGLLFIHGILAGKSAPSGMTIPILYAAVGRRLGYPLRLVQAKGHLFLRWDGPKATERFNIEVTPKGLRYPPDKHYETWPAKLSKAELAGGRFLGSLTPARELAAFLAARGHCLLDTGRLAGAHEAYATACRLAPREPSYLAWLGESVRRHTDGASLATRRPGAKGKAAGADPTARPDPMAELRRIEAINERNRRLMGLGPHRPSPAVPGNPRSPGPSPRRPGYPVGVPSPERPPGR